MPVVSTRLTKPRNGIDTPGRIAVFCGGPLGGEVVRPPVGMRSIHIKRNTPEMVVATYEFTHKRFNGVEVWACPYSILFEYIVSFADQKLPPIVRGIVDHAMTGKINLTRTKVNVGIGGAPELSAQQQLKLINEVI